MFLSMKLVKPNGPNPSNIFFKYSILFVILFHLLSISHTLFKHTQKVKIQKPHDCICTSQVASIKMIFHSLQKKN